MKQTQWITLLVTLVFLGGSIMMTALSEGVELITDDYAIVYPDYADRKEISASKSLQKAIQNVGVKLEIETDWSRKGETIPEAAFEILIGETNRPESLAAKAKLKRDDFIINRVGNRIVILGGTPTATVQAVNCFKERFISSNGVLLPSEPCYFRGSYRTEKLLVNGVDISEFTIVTRGLKATDKKLVDDLIEWIADVSGDILMVADADEATGHTITIARTEDGICAIDETDGNITIRGGGDTGLEFALTDFKAPILMNLNTRETCVVLESKTINTEYTPLVTLNLPAEYPPMDVTASTEGVMAAFEQAKAELPNEITVLEPVYPEAYPYSLMNSVFVAPDGHDDATGTIDDPLKTPEAALVKLLNKKGGVLYLREGAYTVSGLNVLPEHSGTDFSPLFITAYHHEAVTLTGGVDVPAASFHPVSDANVLARLKPEAADSILVADLREIGIRPENLPGYTRSTRPTLFINGAEGTLARYPNAGKTVKIGQILKIGKVSSQHSQLYGKDHTDGWSFKLTDEHPLTWRQTEDIWLYGSVHAEWEKRHYPVRILQETQAVCSPENDHYGPVYKSSNTFYFYNILEELDAPGEWYLDRENGLLYIYPGAELESVSLVLSSSPIIRMDNASNVVVNGLSITGTMSNGIVVSNGYQNIVQNCRVFSCGSSGMTINGMKSGVIYSEFARNANHQVFMADTPRVPLTPSYNFIQNCRIVDPATKYGTFTGGVGYVISHNYYEESMAYVSASNEAIIEYNEFNYGPESEDAGMIYVNGHYLSSRGNHIRYNYMHNFREAHAGVYIDDCASGQYVYGNIVDVDRSIAKYNWLGGVMSYRTHTGRECVFWNNISLNATVAGFSDEAHYYAIATESAMRWPVIREEILTDGRDLVQDPVFSARYPIYVTYYSRMLQHAEEIKQPGYLRSLLEDSIRAPEFCVYGNNVIINTWSALKISDVGKQTAGGMDTNYVSQTSPLDENYHIVDESAAAIMTEWEDIPFEKIGIVEIP